MDLDAYVRELDASTEVVRTFAKGCSAEQLAAAKPGGWTVLQVLEHILLTERLITTIVGRPSERMSPEEELVGAGKIHHLTVVRRDRKVQAPEVLQPQSTLRDTVMFEESFVSQRQKLKESLRSGAIVVDHRLHRHPVFGDMSIADWLHFLIGHTQRHLDQMREILTPQL